MAIMALHLISGASVNFEKKMNISKFFAKTWLFLGFSIWSFGVAAQDMPGGPKDNQLNFTAPATNCINTYPIITCHHAIPKINIGRINKVNM